MGSRNRVRFFVEDHGHEAFLRALLARLGREVGLQLDVEGGSSTGGLGAAVTSLRAYQRSVRLGQMDVPRSDLLVVLLDANQAGHGTRMVEAQGAVDETLFPHSVIGCPDPYVEAWYLADPDSASTVLGARPGPEPASRRDKAAYKTVLRETVALGGHPETEGGVEFAYELVDAMPLDSIYQRSPSLGQFVSELRAALLRLRDEPRLSG